jgi:hypothetical protein
MQRALRRPIQRILAKTWPLIANQTSVDDRYRVALIKRAFKALA